MARGDPFLVAPLIVQVPHDGRVFRRYLIEDGERISFVGPVAIEVGGDMILVKGFLPYIRKKSFPGSRLTARHEGMAGLVPTIEITDYGDPLGVRRPDREIGAAVAAVGQRVSPEFVVKQKMLAFIEKIKIVVRQKTYRRLGDYFQNDLPFFGQTQGFAAT